MTSKLALAALFSMTVALPAAAQLAQNDELRARLPPEILKSGQMVSVNNGSFPPYQIVEGTELTGATRDLSDAIGQLLGVEITHTSVAGLPAVLTGIASGRYTFAIGPVGDYPDREAANDFVDWVKEYVVFGVQSGNPAGITDLAATCGKRIAVMAGGSAEGVINTQSANCVAEGKPAVEVQSFADQPSSILAVRSNRSDAFFSSQAPLTHFVQQSGGALELAAVGQDNGFGDIHQGAVVPKDSPLGPVLLDAFQILMDNGTYKEIMTKWGLEGNMTDAPGINLAGKEAAQ
ncbi:ABC transporter substrate-binding protein [Paracoccus luteus]|uniref:ABC transporter substrate-binding protein n=1 Tax=Paracoccus luteus TaxID=2508543 RepID=UPI001FE9CCBC|nr:ABC transporter substrate-binding protein [Paracoccus luteus]